MSKNWDNEVDLSSSSVGHAASPPASAQSQQAQFGRGRPILGSQTSQEENKSSAAMSSSKLSVNAAVFVPRNFPAPPPQIQNGGPGNLPGQFVSNVNPVEETRKAVNLMTSNPASFDKTMPQLTQTLSSTIHSEEILLSIIELIITQAIRDANFRYTGARICQYLSQQLALQMPNGNFRQHLLARCRSEHNKRHDLIKGSDTRPEVLGFTLFIGELLLNMSVNNKRITTLATAIQDQLSTLLAHPAEDTLKCTVQAIKLTGVILEDEEKNLNADRQTPKLNHIFGQIKTCLLDEKIRRTMKSMLMSVVELRASNWGGQTPEPPSDLHIQENQTPPRDVPMGPVFYQNGQPVMYGGEEYYPADDQFNYPPPEADMMMPGGPGWSNNDDFYCFDSDDNPCYDDGMDDEIAAAFEVFVKESQQQKSNQQQSKRYTNPR